MLPELAAWALPGKWLEILIFALYPRQTESETLGVRRVACILTSSPGGSNDRWSLRPTLLETEGWDKASRHPQFQSWHPYDGWSIIFAKESNSNSFCTIPLLHTHTYTQKYTERGKMLCFSFLLCFTSVIRALCGLNKRICIRINLLVGCLEGRCGPPLLRQAENKHSRRSPNWPSATGARGGICVLLGWCLLRGCLTLRP